MAVEHHLLFAVLAFEDELIDLQQLTAACRAWASDKSKPLADLLVERGWITAEHRRFLEDKAERKLAKHQNDPRVTLNAATRGDVCDALLKEVDDSDVRQSLSSWPSVAPVLIETLIDSGESKSRYTWVSEVGAGGLGKVWLARDNNLAREVALKEIKLGAESREAVRRLIKEAQITGQLQHPGIVPIYEVNHEGRPFYTMKLVKGDTLSQAIARHHRQFRADDAIPDDSFDICHTMTPGISQTLYEKTRSAEARQAEALSTQHLMSVFVSVCEAIAYAHSRGVIHRDLKPDNIVLGEYGEAIVLDWGLARQVSSDDEDSMPIVVTEEGQTAATRAGATPGTPAYMAPEQASGRVEHMDARTDIYGLGAILFEILSGQPPHRVQKDADPASSSTRVDGPPPQSPIVAMLHRIATGETPRVQSIDKTIPDELDTICATAMAKHRDERYQTAKDLKAALLEFQVHEDSIELASRATRDMKEAIGSQKYEDFSRARFGFEQAVELWSDNDNAHTGYRQLCLEFARCAQSRGDFDLSMSLLDPTWPEHKALYDELLDAKNTVLARERQLEEQKAARARMRRIMTVGTAAALITISGLAGWAVLEREKAVKQEQLAITNAEEARSQEGIARENEQKALIARNDAVEAQKKEAEQRLLAEKAKDTAVMVQKKEAEQRLLAIAAQKIAERNAYNSDMLLAQRDWEVSNIAHLLEMLDRYRDRDDLKGFEWGYWEHLTHTDLLTLKGHTRGVTSVAFSPDGQRLASASGDRTVKVWDAISGQETLTLNGHTAEVTCVAFSIDGKRLASGSRDRTVKVWDVISGQEILTLNGHADEVTCVAFSVDGKRLASGSSDRTVKLWDTTSGQQTHALTENSAAVTSVAFSQDGKRLQSVSYDETVKVWDLTRMLPATTGQELPTFVERTSPSLRLQIGYVTGMTLSADGNKLALAVYDGTAETTDSVSVWDAMSLQEPLALNGPTGRVRSLAFSLDGKRLASAGDDQTVKVWDATSGQEIFTLKGHTDDITSVTFSHDGKRLASASIDRTVKVWDATSGQESLTLKGSTDAVWNAAFSADGNRLASANRNRTLKVWDTTSGQETLTLIVDAMSVAISLDGKRLASANRDGTVKVWDSTSGLETLTLKGHTSQVRSVAFNADGRRLASASDDGTVIVWDATSGQETLTLKGHGSGGNCVAFSADGKRLASASWRGNSSGDPGVVKVWDALSGQEILTLKGHNDVVMSLAFNADGNRLASASHDGTVKVWDTTSGQETLTLKGHTGPVASVTFSADGNRLASASGDRLTGSKPGEVKIWDAMNGQEMLTLSGHAGSVTSVSFCADGTRLASASFDGTVKLWDARPWTPELRAQSQARGLLTVKRDRVKSLEELQATIRSDKSISDMVRQQALDWAELFWKNREPVQK